MDAREIKEFGRKVRPNENVTYDAISALCVAPKESADAVYDIFVRHGYHIDTVPSEFFKIFSMNDRERAELDTIVLPKIEELGLKEVFQANLRPATFKRDFVARVEFCKNNDFPFYNEENIFNEALYWTDAFAEYTAHKPVEMIKTAQELDPNIHKESKKIEQELASLDEEDRQVYNEIVTNLNYLILKNPTIEYLPMLVNNITKNIIPSLVRKEYRFLPLSDIVTSVMFDGVDVTPEMEGAHDLVLSAFPEEREMSEGRGLA